MEVGSSSLPGTTSDSLGGLAQLARAPALQAGGQRFESVILHSPHIEEEIFDILTHKTVSKRLCFFDWVKSQITADSMSYFPLATAEVNGERKLGRLVDALALGGDEGRDKLR